MSVRLEEQSTADPLRNVAVFLGAGIPDSDRWSGYFDAREITDAVVAAARAVLTAGGVLVSAMHPTVAPLLLHVAAEFPVAADQPRVLIYQSALYESVIPPTTRRFEEQGVGALRIVESSPDDNLESGRREASLLLMRERMFKETTPRAGIFIGGMDGIKAELHLLRSVIPGSWSYPVAKPGGVSAELTEYAPKEVRELLSESAVYPTVFRKIVEDLTSRLAAES